MRKRAKLADTHFSGGGSSAWAPRDRRLDAIVHRLNCTGPLGWLNVMKYATAEECVGTYAQLCVAFGPGARKKSKVFFVRSGEVMAFLSPEERVRVFSLVSTQALRGAGAMERTAKFGRPLEYNPVGAALVLADGSLALDRVERASIRFPSLKDVTVNLYGALSDLKGLRAFQNSRRAHPTDSKGFTDAGRAAILAKLCTFTFVTRLVLCENNIAVLPDAIGALTKLKELSLTGNNITALPDSIGSLRALTTLSLADNKLAGLPDAMGQLTALKNLYLGDNQLSSLPEWICQLTGLERLDLLNNDLSSLPDSIVALTNLRQLDINGNRRLIRSAQSDAVQVWLQGLEDNPMCNLWWRH